MRKLTTKEFIERAKEIHGDKYNYSKVNYTNSSTKVCIICKEHGEFWQLPSEHLRKQGCPKCANKNITTEEFIKKAKKIHGEKYDYSKVNYIDNKTKVCIICPIHGEFWQTPDKHINRKQGCSACSNKKKKTTEEYIKNVKKIHGNKYNYSKLEYINNHTKVCIICPIHGEFLQNPKAHLYGCGCPKCNSSHLEEEIRLFLQKNKINFEEQKKFNWLKMLTLDFYIPQYNMGIECQGEQHFKGWNGNIKSLLEIQIRDERKRNLCKENNVKLLYYSNLGIDYPYKVYENKEELLKEITNPSGS